MEEAGKGDGSEARRPGAGHGMGPPHVHGWATLVETLVACGMDVGLNNNNYWAQYDLATKLRGNCAQSPSSSPATCTSKTHASSSTA